MPEEFQRRLPSVFRRVSEISQDDIRVHIVGTVIDAKEGRIVVDDGTGGVSVTVPQGAKPILNSLVRVFGRVIPVEGGLELQGEVVQDMSGLDYSLFKKAVEVESNLSLKANK